MNPTPEAITVKKIEEKLRAAGEAILTLTHVVLKERDARHVLEWSLRGMAEKIKSLEAEHVLTKDYLERNHFDSRSAEEEILTLQHVLLKKRRDKVMVESSLQEKDRKIYKLETELVLAKADLEKNKLEERAAEEEIKTLKRVVLKEREERHMLEGSLRRKDEKIVSLESELVLTKNHKLEEEYAAFEGNISKTKPSMAKISMEEQKQAFERALLTAKMELKEPLVKSELFEKPFEKPFNTARDFFVNRHRNTMQKNKNWILQVNKSKLVLGDSNLAKIGRHNYQQLQIESYPGAKFQHGAHLLATARMSQRVEKIICSFGINNRSQKPQTAIKEIEQLISAAKKRFPLAEVFVLLLQFSERLPQGEISTLKEVNAYLIRNQKYLLPPPDENFRTAADNVHWTCDTAQRFLRNFADCLNLPDSRCRV